MFKRYEREEDTSHESAESRGYMAELDAWLEETVFEPIKEAVAAGDAKELHQCFAESKLQIKRKVLASYHNGLKAKSVNRQKYERTTYRNR